MTGSISTFALYLNCLFMKPEPATHRLIKDTATLSRTSESRAQGLFLAEGEKVVRELLQSPLETAYVLVRNDMQNAVPSGIKVPVYTCSSADFDKVSALKTPAGILAVGRRPEAGRPAVPSPGHWVLAVDGISDPGNLGTILRTAEWFGIGEVVCAPGSADCYSSKVVQSAMGSLFRMKVHYMPLLQYIKDVKEAQGVHVFAAALTGTPLHNSPQLDCGVLVIGSESHGISAEVMAVVTNAVTILPAPDSITESLNAAVACGILLQHFCGKK